VVGGVSWRDGEAEARSAWWRSGRRVSHCIGASGAGPSSSSEASRRARNRRRVARWT